jgi:hypothetical protein
MGGSFLFLHVVGDQAFENEPEEAGYVHPGVRPLPKDSNPPLAPTHQIRRCDENAGTVLERNKRGCKLVYKAK